MSAFAVDLDRMYRLVLATPEPSLKSRLGFWLLNSEFHCVACYRYGQYVDRLLADHRPLAKLARFVHRVWNRRVTHVHHTEISRGARIGPGFLLMHRQGVTIGPAEIGSSCVIHQYVTLGQRVAGGDHGVPRIGNNVWIGPGAIITGSITIGDGATIAAGTVLSRDVPPGCLVGGNPGRVIVRDYDNSSMLNYVLPERAAQ